MDTIRPCLYGERGSKMNLLTEGIDKGYVLPTEQKVKHTLDDDTKLYKVYKIRTDLLFYNDQNDRIATWVSAYNAEHSKPLKSLSLSEYNDVIESFIVNSNTDAIRKTETNIELVGQRVPGVVLNDGRVIDGNRRLTCIRRIARKRTETGWFEAAILDDAASSDAKRIKMLELAIQLGEEEKVDYDPVERLVGIYNDVIKTGLLSKDEYAKAAGLKPKEVDKLIQRALYMEEFLEFVNAKEQYHLARELALDGPLGELDAILKKEKSEKDKALMKRFVFSNIIVQPEGDITRSVRKFKKVAGTDAEPQFRAEEQRAMSSLIEAMGAEPLTKEKVRDIRSNDRLVKMFQMPIDKANEVVQRERLVDAPLKKSQEAYTCLTQILPEMLMKLGPDDRAMVIDELNDVAELARDLTRIINALK